MLLSINIYSGVYGKDNGLTVNEEKIDSKDRARDKIRHRYQDTNNVDIEVIPPKPSDRDIFNTDHEQRVAVYARVSTDGLSQVSSYELQIAHYGDMVSQRPNWELVGIYADEGISGTSLEHRDNFLRMIDDCLSGKVDLVVTKSVSRFARNIVDCISTVRKLRSLDPPVGVYFESENIFTLKPDYEMQLTFASSMAQEESHIKSNTMTMSYEMRFKRGIFMTPELYGYDRDKDGNLVVNESEARVVSLIYYLYLYGYGCKSIAERLTNMKIPTPSGNDTWSFSTVTQILRNERHCGDILAQKTWTIDYLNHRTRKNRGDKAQYYKKDHHEPIVSREDYVAVQSLLDMSRHGFISVSPELRAISSGILKGFVCINPRWNRFGMEEYIEASKIVKKRFNCPERICVAVEPGEEDLSDYEVVRGEFLGGRDQITITFKGKEVLFSMSAIRKMDMEYVEMLIDPIGGYIAVRKGEAKGCHSIFWCSIKNGKYIKRPVNAAGFIDVVRELFSWNKELNYRINGVFLERKDERLLFFDLRHTEILIPRQYATAIGPDGKQPWGSVVAYKKEWLGSFGDSYYGSKFLSPVNIFKDTNKWNVEQKAVVAIEPKIRLKDREELQVDIDRLMQDISSDGKEENDE